MALPISPTGKALEVFQRTPGCVTVAVSAWPPLVDVRPLPFTGSHVSVFRLVMERLKWCYYLVATPDDQWGDKLNGTWTGMVGMVDRKEADIALGPLGVTLLRTEVVDFATAYMNCDNNFLYKAVTTIEPDMLIFAKSFEDQVWQYVSIALVAVGISAAILNIFNSYLCPSDLEEYAESKRSTSVRAMLWSLRMLLAQDAVWAPRGDSGRMLAIIWMFMCAILSLMYRCNLKAILITNKVKPPFDSMEELVQQDEYKWTLVDGTYYGGFFKNAHITKPDTVQGKMWPLKDDPIKDAYSVINVTLSKKVGVIAPRVFHMGFLADDFSAHGRCRLSYTTYGFHDIYLTFGYAKKSPLREPMDMMLLRLNQAGLPDHIQDYELRNASWCINPKKSNSETRPFAIGDFLGLFILYGIGCAAGFLSLLMECYVHKMKSQRRLSKEAERVGQEPERDDTGVSDTGLYAISQAGGADEPKINSGKLDKN